MKLKDFSSLSGAGDASGKRRKRQLLIEPPPPPSEPVSEFGDEGERKCHLLNLSECCRAPTTNTITTSARDKNTISYRCHHNHHQLDMMKHRDHCQSRLPTVASQMKHHQANHLNDQHGQHLQSSAASVIIQRNKWRRGAPLDDIGQNQRHSRLAGDTQLENDFHQRDKQQVARDPTTTTTTKRKSELTSFLTILFGSLLAALLLAGNNQPTLCSSDLRINVSSSNVMHQNASALLRILPMTSSSSSSSTTAQPTLVNGTLAGRAAAAAAAAAAATAADDFSPETSEDEDAPADGEQESRAEETTASHENPHETRLARLLSESARDATDTLLGHLQPPSGNVEPATVEPEEPEVGAGAGAGPGPGQGAPSAGKDEEGMEEPTGARASPLKLEHASDELLPAGMDEATRAAMGVYAKWRFAADDLIELFSRKLMPVVMEHGYEVDAGTVAGLLQIFNGIRSLRPWAVKLLDASFKLAPGILVGTQSDFGDFDECLNIRVDDPSGLAAVADDTYSYASQLDPLTGLKSTTLVGRYCLADVEFPKPTRRRRLAPHTGGYTPNTTGASQLDQFEPIELRNTLLDFSQFPAYKDTIFVETGNFFHMLYVDPIRVGVCMTNKIDPEALAQLANKLLDEFKITINFRGRCATKYDRPTWTVYQRVSAYVLLVACSLVLISTLLDLMHAKLNKWPCPRGWHEGRLRLQLAASKHRALFTSFSLIRNTRRLFRKPPGGCKPHKPPVSHSNGLGYAASLAATTTTTTMASSQAASSTSTSSLADSSVESSPAIERRSSVGAGSAEPLNSSMNHLIQQQQQQQHHHYGREFSNYHHHQFTSEHQLMKEGASGSEQPAVANLMSLHGIRVLTMTWMIVNHTYMFGGFFVLWAHRRLIDIAEWPKSLSFQMVLNGWLTVETYFFLSALIIVLTVMPLMKARKFNYFVYILHRLLRLLPAYLGLVCLNFLWPLISAGPVWLVKGKSFVQTPCEQYLWTNFIFINNWIWPEKQCMVHTWFLSADFQLYLLAPIIVYLLYRLPALGHSLNLLVAICASILSGFVIYANELLPTTLINKLEFDAIKQQLSYSYFATYQHMGPYCLGILTGYLLHKRPHARLPKHLTCLLWLLLPPLSFTTLLLTYLWNGAYNDPALINPSPLVSAFYVAIHRTIWTALLAWLVFACATGRAKLLSSFLSHSLFLPISRLSYSIYLVHLPVIMFRSLNLRHTLEWTDQNILWEACGNFLVSIFMGYFLNVAFESPIINLENALTRGNRNRATCHAGDGPMKKQQATIFQTNKHLGLVMNGKQPSKTDISILEHKQQLQATQAGFSSYLTGASSSAASDSASDGCPRDDDATLKATSSHEEPPRVNPRSSSLACGGSVLSADTVTQVRRKSLRPKQTSSVEQIFGYHEHEGCEPHIGHHQIADTTTTASSSLTSTGSPGQEDEGQQQQQLQQLAMADNQDRLFAEKSLRRQSRGRSTQINGDDIDQEDIVYSMSNEYRHYAPAGYQQWRRAMNNQHNHQRLNGLNSMATSLMGPRTNGRPQQYATLARSSRLCPDPSMSTMIISSDFHSAQEPSRRYQHSSRMLAQREMNGHHHHHQGQLFPNSSEFEMSPRDYHHPLDLVDSRQMDQLHQLQGAVSSTQRQHRARPARYNTLTGARTGHSDWRSQLTPGPGQENDLMSSWDAPSAWLANSARSPNSSGGRPSLMIPRVDSSTLRRHSQHARDQSNSLSGHHHHHHHQQQQQQEQHEFIDSKIVEEPVVEENSAL